MAAPGARLQDDERSQDNFAKLERLVRSLVDRYEALRVEHSALSESLRERDERIRRLDERLLELNQLRQDTAKRIDDLIAQIDQLDVSLESRSGGTGTESR